MRQLIIGPGEKAAVAAVVSYAEAHRVPLERLKYLMTHPQDSPGHTPGYVCVLPVGFRCVFTIEQQPSAHLSWCRHISISVMHHTRCPHEYAVAAILPLFGFRWSVRKLAEFGLVSVMQETYASVNLLEPLNLTGLEAALTQKGFPA